MSRAASGLVRALVARRPIEWDRILLIEIRSVDWQSLTFTGERHAASFRIRGPGAREIAGAFVAGLDEAEFESPGHFVADIGNTLIVAEENGSVLVTIEALTISE